jgi:transposase
MGWDRLAGYCRHEGVIDGACGLGSVQLTKVGLETGSLRSWLAHELGAAGFAVVCMDARRAADFRGTYPGIFPSTAGL